MKTAPSMHRPLSRQSAFTLLELLVVVFIIGVMAAMFTLSVGLAGGTDKELRREGERLQTLLRLALEDANFQSHELGLRLYPDRYEFSAFQEPGARDTEKDKESQKPKDILDSATGNADEPREQAQGTWVVIKEDVFAPVKVPEAFELSLEIEGRVVDLARSESDAEKVYKPQIFIWSSGDFSDGFDIHLRSREEDRAYTLTVATDGSSTLKKDGT